MARGKLIMERTQNSTTTAQGNTFCKRRLELLQKARELSILCDAQVALIGFSSSGRLFQFAGSSWSMQEIIQAYLDTHEGKPLKPLASYPFHDSQYEMESLEEEVQRLQEEERYMGEGKMEELQFLSLTELEQLERELASGLSSVRRTKDLLMAEQREELVRKEQELLRENKSLRKKLKRMEKAVISTCSSYNDEDTTASDSFCSSGVRSSLS